MNAHQLPPTFLLVVLFAISSPTAVNGEPKRQASRSELESADRRIVDQQAIVSPGRLVVVYFTPRDRDPAKNHTARIRRIVEATAGFYEQELEHHGFPDRKMNVLLNAAGVVEVIDVVGADTHYDKPDGRRIRNEVIPVLRQKQIDPEQSVILLFCNLMNYDADARTISHHSPYYGGGTHISGTAWQCDSEILDPQSFTDLTPLFDGEYGNITIGKHNSIFIGGVVHELGHALSLPHCRQRNDEAVRGTALMGSGNRTFQEQVRGEGLGTFLTQANALRLAAHPVFLKRVWASLYDRPKTDWSELAIRSMDGSAIRIDGAVNSTIPVHAVIAYFDPAGRGDYDATTATAVPKDNGTFALRSGKLEAGLPGQLRLVACHVSGATSRRSFSYRIDKAGKPDLSSARLMLELEPMIDALQRNDFDEAKKLLAQDAAEDPELQTIGRRVLDRFTQPSAGDNETWLTALKPTIERVGWHRPTYDKVPEQPPLLSIDGDVFAKGIYAHAPARHQYSLDRNWQRFRGRCGIQSGHSGTVDFVVTADAKIVWAARQVSEGQGRSFDLDVTGVQTLLLTVTDGENGKNNDWGVWIEPRLTQSVDEPSENRSR